MKTMRKLVLTVACAAVAVFLGAQIAAASCLDMWGGKDGGNFATCDLVSSTATTCTYSCICIGDCSNIYAFFGARKLN